MSYQVDTTTTQQLQQNTASDNNTISPEFGLTDDVFERKLGRLSFTYSRAISQWNVAYYNEKRTSQRTAETEQTYGVSASLKWRLGARTNFSITGTSESRKFDNEDSSDKTHIAAVSFNRNLERRSSASIGFRSINQDSDVESRSYSENRIFASANIVFTNQ